MRLFLFVLLSTAAFGQASGNVTMVLFPSTPSGSCNARQIALNQSNAALYTCNSSAWQIISGGGGGWNPPNAGANTIFGNNSPASGQPSFFSVNGAGDITFAGGTFSVNSLHFGSTQTVLGTTGIANGNCLQFSSTGIIGGPCGTGGTGLLGCTTTTSGNLTCDTSVAVTAAGTGMVQLSRGTLPTPPSGANGALAVDGSGILNFSPGNNGAFAPVASTGTPTLNGCTNPSGTLNCNTSFTLGNNGSGISYESGSQAGQLILSHSTAPLWFSGSGTGTLQPPANAGISALVTDQNGALYFSPGNGVPWAPLGGGGGNSATSLTFASAVPLGSANPTAGQCLIYDGANMVGGPCSSGVSMGGVVEIQ